MSYSVNRTSKITSIDYTRTIETKIEIGKVYSHGGYLVKIAEFMTVGEFFSQHDLSAEAQEYEETFYKGRDYDDYDDFDDDIVVVFTNTDEDLKNAVYLPLQNFLDVLDK